MVYCMIGDEQGSDIIPFANYYRIQIKIIKGNINLFYATGRKILCYW